MLHTYKISIDLRSNNVVYKIAQIKTIRVIFGIGLKEAKDIVDQINEGRTKTFESVIDIRDDAYANALFAGIKIVKDEPAAPETLRVTEFNDEMVTLTKIMQRSVITDNERLHRAGVALLDQIFLEQK